MANVEPLNPPLYGMERFLNVTQKVGDGRDCANSPSDVEAVQRLISLAGAGFATKHGFGLPQPTGKFDPITAYYIFHVQVTQNAFRVGAVVDGCVSRARGVSNAGGYPYAIVNLNLNARQVNPGGWDQLLNRFSLTT